MIRTRTDAPLAVVKGSIYTGGLLHTHSVASSPLRQITSSNLEDAVSTEHCTTSVGRSRTHIVQTPCQESLLQCKTWSIRKKIRRTDPPYEPAKLGPQNLSKSNETEARGAGRGGGIFPTKDMYDPNITQSAPIKVSSKALPYNRRFRRVHRWVKVSRKSWNDPEAPKTSLRRVLDVWGIYHFRSDRLLLDHNSRSKVFQVAEGDPTAGILFVCVCPTVWRVSPPIPLTTCYSKR